MRKNLTDEQIYKTLHLADMRYSLVDSDHRKSSNYKLELMMLSKFSVIEFCGWIEMTLDTILKTYLKLKVRNKSVCDDVAEEIDKVYGCDPQKHIRPMLRRIIGAKAYSHYVGSCPDFDSICAAVDAIGGKPTQSAQLSGMKLQPKRNVAAHTCLIPAAQTYFNAPSKVLYELKAVHPLLWKLRRDLLRSY